MTPAALQGVVNDAIAIYFLDATSAAAFVARCCAGLKIELRDGAFRVREHAPTPRVMTGFTKRSERPGSSQRRRLQDAEAMVYPSGGLACPCRQQPPWRRWDRRFQFRGRTSRFRASAGFLHAQQRPQDAGRSCRALLPRPGFAASLRPTRPYLSATACRDKRRGLEIRCSPSWHVIRWVETCSIAMTCCEPACACVPPRFVEYRGAWVQNWVQPERHARPRLPDLEVKIQPMEPVGRCRRPKWQTSGPGRAGVWRGWR
jgi:hypothetical protein